MNIHYKGLIANRFDAPFIGTLWIAPDCTAHCHGCCNQHLLRLPIIEESSVSIIDKIRRDPFSEGIILAGLEPLTYYDEVLDLIERAVANKLEVILYTHYTMEDIQHMYSGLLLYKGIYIKCGAYDESKLSATHTSYGVPLASTNQRIYKVGEDI